MKKEPTTTMTARLPLSLKLQVEMAVNNDGRTVNSLVNKVLKDYIDEQKKIRTEKLISVLKSYLHFSTIH